MTLPTTPTSSEASRRPRFGWAAIACIAVALVAPALAWLRWDGGSNEQELAAKAGLTKLGALVVMDSDRRHVASVNLATLHSPELLGDAVALLPALSHLTSLNADHTALNDEQAAVLGRLTSLEDLVLNHTAITDAGVNELRRLASLKSLHLSDAAITNAALPALKQLPSLAILDISGTKITGNFAGLSELEKLNWLVARRLTLDAADMAAIANCAGLHRLSLNETHCSAAALADLAEKRPDLTIDR